MSEYCISLRKDGRSCQGQGLYFHPECNGLVCNTHRPGGPRMRAERARGLELKYADYAKTQAEAAERYERERKALVVILSDAGLQALLEDLRKFRNGERLRPKTRKILDGILSEDNHRQSHRAGK